MRRATGRRGGRAAALALAAAALGWAAPAAAIDVFLRSPRTTEPLFGEVTIEAEVLSAVPVAEVVITVDGREAARLTEPPWRATIDLGQGNRPHRIEVAATDVAGATATAELETRSIPVQDSLDLSLQQVYVTVSRGGRRVLDLERGDFTVLDEGAPQTLVTFERGDVPFTAVVLLDTSTSMRGDQLATAVDGARSFVAGMRDHDEAMLTLFSDRELASTPFTGDPAEATAALARVTASGGTALDDHLYLALKRLEARQGRRVVVLLSDGIDVHSLLGIDDVAWIARRSQALIYWIRLGAEGGHSSAWRDRAGHAHEVAGLERVVAESGGRIYPISRVAEAKAVFAEILAELREQYVLGYYPIVDRDDGSWRKVRLRVGGGYEVRARDGYLDF
jgi:Ca-activated chloride channel family protein